ncbi:C-C motif chemokine 20 [Bagarius yarrelli]|uniref:C-C motif chemokine n=1 Tax=Bagarius yarrelli TaxID=175774 RepID=A0A556UF76_BAGYA|nr:C-C motif chemokine 20 [Bagarius yarrelli]
MSLKGTLTIVFAGIWLLCMCCQKTDAYGPLNHACCIKYTRTPLDFKVIKGYAVQSSREVCRIDAIIFLTKSNKKVCASAEDEWVQKVLDQLRYFFFLFISLNHQSCTHFELTTHCRLTVVNRTRFLPRSTLTCLFLCSNKIKKLSKHQANQVNHTPTWKSSTSV